LREDWIDRKTNFPLDQPVWAAVPRQCPGCDELGRVQSRVPRQMRGVHVVLIPFSHLEDGEDEIHHREVPQPEPDQGEVVNPATKPGNAKMT
jgi:hypothetical protein